MKMDNGKKNITNLNLLWISKFFYVRDFIYTVEIKKVKLIKLYADM